MTGTAVIERYLEASLRSSGLDPGLAGWVRSMAGAEFQELAARYASRPPTPEDMAAMAAALLERNQQAVLGHLRNLEPGFAFACAPGCSHCCHAHLVAMPHEAIALFRALPGFLGHEEILGVRGFCREVAAGWPEDRDDERAARIVRAHFAPCPFLRQGSCAVYGARPVACRNWFSRSVEACRDSFASGNQTAVGQVAIVMHLKDIAYAAHAALCGELGIDGGLVSLFVAMDALFNDAGGTLARWATGEPFPGRVFSL